MTDKTEREALSDAEIEKGWHATFSTSNPYCPCNLKSFTKVVRWAESTIRAAPRPVSAPVKQPLPQSAMLTTERISQLANEHFGHWSTQHQAFARAIEAECASPPTEATFDASAKSKRYVETVPDHCDRIVWRGNYYSLALLAPAVSAGQVAKALLKCNLSGVSIGDKAIIKCAAKILAAGPSSSVGVMVSGDYDWKIEP